MAWRTSQFHLFHCFSFLLGIPIGCKVRILQPTRGSDLSAWHMAIQWPGSTGCINIPLGAYKRPKGPTTAPDAAYRRWILGADWIGTKSDLRGNLDWVQAEDFLKTLQWDISVAEDWWVKILWRSREREEQGKAVHQRIDTSPAELESSFVTPKRDKAIFLKQIKGTLAVNAKNTWKKPRWPQSNNICSKGRKAVRIQTKWGWTRKQMELTVAEDNVVWSECEQTNQRKSGNKMVPPRSLRSQLHQI